LDSKEQCHCQPLVACLQVRDAFEAAAEETGRQLTRTTYGERSSKLMISALETEVESLRHAVALKEHDLGLSAEQRRTLESNVQQAAEGLASERRHIHALREDLAQRHRAAAQRALAVASSLVEVVHAAAPDAPELVSLLARVRAEEALAEADAGTLCQELAVVIQGRLRQLLWERQCCEDELVASKEAALRAAASMEEHSKATQQLAATLTDEIARAKAGEEQSAETAEELKRRVAADQASMEAEKVVVRQQVAQLMTGAVRAREAAAAGIRESSVAREAAEARAAAALEEAVALRARLADAEAKLAATQVVVHTQLIKVERAESCVSEVEEGLGGKLARAEEALKVARTEAARHKEEVSRLKRVDAELELARKAADSMREKASKLGAQLSDARAGRAAAEKKAKELQAKVPDLQKDVSNQELGKQKLLDDKNKHFALATRASKELEELKKNKTFLEGRVAHSMEQLHTTQAAKGALQTKLDTAAKREEASKKAKEQYVAQLTSAEQALSAARTEISILQERERNFRAKDEELASMTRQLGEATTARLHAEAKCKIVNEKEEEWFEQKKFLLTAQDAALQVADNAGHAKADRMREMRDALVELGEHNNSLEQELAHTTDRLATQVELRERMEQEVTALRMGGGGGGGPMQYLHGQSTGGPTPAHADGFSTTEAARLQSELAQVRAAAAEERGLLAQRASLDARRLNERAAALEAATEHAQRDSEAKAAAAAAEIQALRQALAIHNKENQLNVQVGVGAAEAKAADAAVRQLAAAHEHVAELQAALTAAQQQQPRATPAQPPASSREAAAAAAAATEAQAREDRMRAELAEATMLSLQEELAGGTRRLERVESALASAREALQSKDAAIAQLRASLTAVAAHQPLPPSSVSSPVRGGGASSVSGSVAGASVPSSPAKTGAAEAASWRAAAEARQRELAVQGDALDAAEVCVNPTQVCVNPTQVCVNPTHVYVNPTQARAEAAEAALATHRAAAVAQGLSQALSSTVHAEAEARVGAAEARAEAAEASLAAARASLTAAEGSSFTTVSAASSGTVAQGAQVRARGSMAAAVGGRHVATHPALNTAAWLYIPEAHQA
jgi:hypothetical protein